jgi:uncharacterized repeat protein (TIGR02543 family)
MTPSVVYATAADGWLRGSENFIGVRYKVALIEDNLPGTEWMLLFNGVHFTQNGEYVPHFLDMMIKGSWSSVYKDGLVANGFLPVERSLDNFGIELGLSDYEDATVQDNDIGAWSQDPLLFPRRFTNIDSTDPKAPDKIMVEYQVPKGGTLEGREVEISLVRGEQTRLARDKNYFMDPDVPSYPPNSQADILYRRWSATVKIPTLGVDSSVDFYINAAQADKILGNEALLVMWENPGRTMVETDKFKVIIYDTEVLTESGQWTKLTKMLVDYRTPRSELPLNQQGQLVGGYRKINYKGIPATEISFGYGYTDYVLDGDPTNYEPTDATKAVIDLTSVSSVAQYLLSTQVGAGAGGTLTLNPPGGLYEAGTQVTITTTPLAGYAFGSWGGDASGSQSPLTITMNTNKNITAYFSLAQYLLSTSVSTEGSGTVTLNPPGGTYATGSQVMLTASPSPGYMFTGWSGDAGGTQNPLIFTMNANKTVTAIFEKLVTADINRDRIVNYRDLAILGAAYGTTRGQKEFDDRADLNKDGVIDQRDLTILGANYGK